MKKKAADLEQELEKSQKYSEELENNLSQQKFKFAQFSGELEKKFKKIQKLSQKFNGENDPDEFA
ncbi:MAG: hypothetical protein ACQEP7_01410 [bacterium]